MVSVESGYETKNRDLFHFNRKSTPGEGETFTCAILKILLRAILKILLDAISIMVTCAILIMFSRAICDKFMNTFST